jgi:hypothetical protein
MKKFPQSNADEKACGEIALPVVNTEEVYWIQLLETNRKKAKK